MRIVCAKMPRPPADSSGLADSGRIRGHYTELACAGPVRDFGASLAPAGLEEALSFSNLATLAKRNWRAGRDESENWKLVAIRN